MINNKSFFITFSTFLFSLIYFAIAAQDLTYSPKKLISGKLLQNDFNILTTALKEGHPGIYSYLSSDSIQYYINKTNSKLTDSLTEGDFHLQIREFITHIKCGHTVSMPSIAYYTYFRNIASLIPFEIFNINQTIYIRENLSNDSNLIKGCEIKSINNIPANEILRCMENIQPRDGLSKTFINKSVQANFRTYFLFLYGMKSEYSITYLNHNNIENTTTVSGNIKPNIPLTFCYDTINFKELSNIQNEKLFILNKNPSIAFLKIESFQQRKYKNFYKNVFQTLQNKNVNNLIIDIRNNGGGYFPNATLLLTYLIKNKFDLTFQHPRIHYTMKSYTKWDFFSKLTKFLFNLKPDRTKTNGLRTYVFNYFPKKKLLFDGNIYLLINGGTFSMSSYVAAYLKNYTKTIIIGEETGGGEDGSNAILMPTITLPETGIRIKLPFYHVDHSVNKNMKGKGVIPDYSINYTINEKINNEDLELNKVLQLINTKY